MKVIALIKLKFAYGWSPEEHLFQHPYHTLGQIHAALAYYWDHSEELEKDIDARCQRIKKLKKMTPDSTLITRLRSQRFID